MKFNNDQANSPDASTETDIPDFKLWQLEEIHTHLAIIAAESRVICIHKFYVTSGDGFRVATVQEETAEVIRDNAADGDGDVCAGLRNRVSG
ncbi:hypothetical protein BPOR_0910g00010 [Botrytis porri]|uniref:Uncharacterized protein n=1 Tax=Botrytis porri TaxID=87229 RepID=A0A4Z1KL07_9HELO|nr:hypothetical protein BPOR_0910g00010 [Botrytis porri]